MVDRVGLRALFALAGRHLSRWAATLGLAGVVVGIAPSSARAQAPVVTAPSAVGVHLLAIEASKEQRGFDEPLRAAGLAAKIEELGYVGAKLADCRPLKCAHRWWCSSNTSINWSCCFMVMART